jgi:hypothetical protein
MQDFGSGVFEYFVTLLKSAVYGILGNLFPAVRRLLTKPRVWQDQCRRADRNGMFNGGIGGTKIMNCINITVVNNLRKSLENPHFKGLAGILVQQLKRMQTRV